jgi:hypothetical protein
MRVYKGLVKEGALLVAFEYSQKQRATTEAEFRKLRKDRDRRCIVAVHAWLSAANTKTIHKSIADARAEYPETGLWLLDLDQFQAWFDPDFCTTLLLWLHRVPGAVCISYSQYCLAARIPLYIILPTIDISH